MILVGGTMKPFDEFINQVFRPAGKVGTDVTLFSCGHVIDAKRQLAIYTPSVSFNNIRWDFTFKVVFESFVYLKVVSNNAIVCKFSESTQLSVN